VIEPLEVRYRRVLTFGDVLDESVQLFRRNWITYALVSAAALLPPGLVVVWLTASGSLGRSFNLTDIESARLSRDSALPATFATSILSIVFELLWTAAIVATTEQYLRGRTPRVGYVYGRAAASFVGLLVGSIVFALGMIGLSLVASVLFVLTLFGTLGSVIALVALLFWWLKPGARKAWVKWLIIVVAPFGLPMYFAIRWSMFAAAVVVEGRGPMAGLKRSSALVDGHVFRVVAILTVSSVIVGVLVYGPVALLEIPLAVSAATRGQVGLNPLETTLASAADIVLRILFAAIGGIVYTLLFFDLRNRREGTDMVERLTQLEASPVETNG
jgi:hypothetical protein